MYEISFSSARLPARSGSAGRGPGTARACGANACAHAMRCGSSASAPWIAGVRWRRPHPSGLVALRATGRALWRAAAPAGSATSCVVNALVDATPTRCPRAWNGTRSAAPSSSSDVADRERRWWPSDFACFSAASVSAVSPDCETTTTSAFGMRHAGGSGTRSRSRRCTGPRQRLDPPLGDQARVVARAAREDQHRVDVAERRRRRLRRRAPASMPAML